jgi:hypothetical protein
VLGRNSRNSRDTLAAVERLAAVEEPTVHGEEAVTRRV